MTKKLPPEVKKQRKPISRACKFCHSKHLQCDQGRPCKNCAKRGLESVCEDVERKKAKYLVAAERQRKKQDQQVQAVQLELGAELEQQADAGLATMPSTHKKRKKNSTAKKKTTTTTTVINDTSDNSQNQAQADFATYTQENLEKSESPPVGGDGRPIPINLGIQGTQTTLSNKSVTPVYSDSHNNGNNDSIRKDVNSADTAFVGNRILSIHNSPVAPNNVMYSDMTSGFIGSNIGNSPGQNQGKAQQHMFFKKSSSSNATNMNPRFDPSTQIHPHPHSDSSHVQAEVIITKPAIQAPKTNSTNKASSLSAYYSSKESSPEDEGEFPLIQPHYQHHPNFASSSVPPPGEIQANNTTDINLLFSGNYNTGLDDSKTKFISSMANDEYAQLTTLITTNPSSPSDFFDIDVNERAYIQLGDNNTYSSSANIENQNHLASVPATNENNIPTTRADITIPNYTQEEDDYMSPLILRHIIKTADDIYLTNIVKSYQYPKAYHALIRYLKLRFNRAQLINIATSMSKYRPSFISATKSLYENDLIFTERSLQRSLLEYENLISMSASPTIIWRRTSEIVAITNEFLTLTGYSRVNLLSKRTFIVELMDDESAIRYFKLFSDIAFGDLNATVLTDCILKKANPSDGFLKCACVWTIKRDVFDIPMLVVGQFLPVLQ
ncbi:hypothetical protein PACTADRAFT_51697 [Pachysolen tannophilus NRRL Y-2460]|uniref:Glucose starvation modulator protein 1 n=1 Tax=Pachysolen tannophilus NRRL Y-2460 TaxID=669874 RepID=A0A1E4TQD0_PACTA|nr:hypothetical protein PACTADRAFT_51697 [Pachysolen tannophilus NRRL Y-2460]